MSQRPDSEATTEQPTEQTVPVPRDVFRLFLSHS